MPIEYDREGIADLIRMEFKRKKEEVTRRKYKPNVRHNTRENWLRAADTCIRLNADPVRFVDACFSACNQPGGPFENQLGGPGAERWWFFTYPKQDTPAASEPEEDTTTTESERYSLVKFEMVSAIKMLIRRTGSADRANWRELILAPTTLMEPYVRIALGYWMPGVKEQYGEKAMRFLSIYPEVPGILKRLGFDVAEFMENYD